MPDPEFDDIVASFVRGGEPRAAAIATLSDLDRSRGATLAAAWPGIPVETRHLVITEAALLAEDDVSYDFERLMLIALSDPEAGVRRLAAAGLGEATDRPAGQLLARALRGDGDPSVRAAAAVALGGVAAAWAGRTGFESALREVLDTLRAAASGDASAEVRGRALVAAAGSAEPWIGALLEDAYYGDDRLLRLAAIEAMGQSCDEQWLDYLLEQLDSDDSEVRSEAAAACGEMGSEDAVDPLAALAGDEDPEVAATAVAALARIGGPLVIEVLNDLRADPPPGLDLALLDAALEEARTAQEAFGRMDER